MAIKSYLFPSEIDNWFLSVYSRGPTSSLQLTRSLISFPGWLAPHQCLRTSFFPPEKQYRILSLGYKLISGMCSVKVSQPLTLWPYTISRCYRVYCIVGPIVQYLSISIALLTVWAFKKLSRPCIALTLCQSLHGEELQATASEGLVTCPIGWSEKTFSLVLIS